MPLEDIVQMILSSCQELTREELLKMIEAKKKKAKGFLTLESAARALAADLGVVSSETSLRRDVSIKDVVSGLSEVTVVGRVITVYPIQKFVRVDGTEGMLRRLLVGDKTGKIKVVLWDDKADMLNVENLTGQIVRFSKGYVRRGFDGMMELNIGSRGAIEIAPQNISDDEFPPLTSFP